MSEINEIYRCNICGNITEVLHIGVGKMECCGNPMKLLTEKTEDMGAEKHVPVIEETGEGVKVKVGSIPHPMEENHHIEWVEVVTDDRIYRKVLNPGDTPQAEFELNPDDIIELREYCSIHSLWKS